MQAESANVVAVALLVAFGGGMLVGADRERCKGHGPARRAIGLRTCVIASLLGACASLAGEAALLASGLGIAALAAVAYWKSRSRDPGMTTEAALLATFALGALATTHPQLSAALFVAVAVTLAAKESLHRFVREAVGEQDLADALRLAALALIGLPLLPDRVVDPLGVLNPHAIGMVAVLVMAIGAAGYIALRVFGPSRGLILAGFLGGFVSSTATIAAMAQRARSLPSLLSGCAAAAIASNVATAIQLAAILAIVSPQLARHVALALAASASASAVFGLIAVFRLRADPATATVASYGRPLAIRQAASFAVVVALALLGAAALRRWMGDGGTLIAAGFAGFADVHAAAIGLAQLVGVSDLPLHTAAEGLAVAFTANSIVKMLAAATGGRAFATRVICATVISNAAFVAFVWLG